MSDLLSPVLLFSLGYVLCLMTPGPNLMVVASVALQRGFWGSLPMCHGVTIGSLALAGGIYWAASAVPAYGSWDRAGRAAGAMLLLWVALQMMLKSSVHNPAPARRSDFTLGFVTASINPITGAFFASQFLAMPDAPTFGELVAVFIVVGAVTFARSMLVALVLGLRIFHGDYARYSTWIRRSVGFAFAGFALTVLMSVAGPQG
jgi:threonine/homoserine/homoserine lactone efflux protein